MFGLSNIIKIIAHSKNYQSYFPQKRLEYLKNSSLNSFFHEFISKLLSILPSKKANSFYFGLNHRQLIQKRQFYLSNQIDLIIKLNTPILQYQNAISRSNLPEFIHPKSKQAFSKIFLNKSYKIRIIVNHEFSQENLENNSPTVQVKIKINPSSLCQQTFGYILLLQRTNTVGNGRRYLQIGKGEIDFNDLIASNANRFSDLKGVIYGTRAYNYDKIIAKYSYMMAKEEVYIAKNNHMNTIDKELTLKKITFKDHKRTDRLPVLKMQSSIADKAFDIDEKFKQLNQSLQKIQQERNHQKAERSSNKTPEKKQSNKEIIKLNPKKSLIDSQILQIENISKQIRPYIYRLSDRVQKIIQTNNFDGLRYIKIKNVKIIDLINEKREQQAQQLIKTKKNMLILIRLYQKGVYSHLRNCIFQIIIQAQLNANNQALNTYFPIQIISDVLMIQIIFTKKSKRPLLTGQIHSTNNIFKIIELFNQKGEQRGFILLQNAKNKKTNFDMNSYNIQLQKFRKILSIFDFNKYNHSFNAQISLNHAQPQQTGFINLQQSRLSNQKKRGIKILSYTQRSSEQDEKTKRIKKYSLQTGQKRNDSVLVNNISSISAKGMLKIKNIYLNIYDHPQMHNFFLKNSCKFRQSQYRRISKGYNNFQIHQNPFLIEFFNEQFIKLACFQQQNKLLLGSTTLNTSQLLRSHQKQLKLFLKKKKTITGYLNIQIDFYKINQSKIQKLKKQRISLPSKIDLSDQYQLQVPSSRIVTIKRPRQRVFNQISRSLPIDKQQFQ